MNYDSLVLLGYSNVGKDTITSLLTADEKCSNFVNAKFSAFTKRLVANALGVDASVLEDKVKRLEAIELDGNTYDLSAFDLLTALFQGGNAKVCDAGIDYLLDTVGADKFPVFTDVRRLTEVKAVLYHYRNPLVLMLYREGVNAGINDGWINALYEYLCTRATHCSINLVPGKPEITVETIKCLLGVN